MPRRARRKLDGALPLYVWHDRSIGGRPFKRGDALPWQALGLDARKVKQLWQLRLLDHEKPPLAPLAAPRRGRPPKSLQPTG